jgi:hypothetical protein
MRKTRWNREAEGALYRQGRNANTGDTPMRMAILTIIVSILATAASAQDRGAQDSHAAAAPAQVAGETTGAGGVPLAPVGHRQPTLNDLPDGVRATEAGRSRGSADPLGPLPKICNAC